MNTNATTPQYVTLASFDFLSADELKNFENITLAATAWNTTLTSYSVSNGVLNITNKDNEDVFLAYPITLNGYAEVKLAGDGAVAVLDPIAYNESKVLGYELVRTSSGITVYMINGTSSKTALASLSTTADTVVVTVMDGKIGFGLEDGTSIYQGSGSGIIALGAVANSTASFDKLTLYGKFLAANTEIDLGQKTIGKEVHVVTFDYDLSKYTNIRQAKIVVSLSNEQTDPWARWVIIGIKTPDGQFFILGQNSQISNAFRWPSTVPSSYSDKYSATIFRSGTFTYDITSIVQKYPKGEIIVGVQTSYVPWSASVKIVLDADTQDTTTEATTTSSHTLSLHGISLSEKYALLGAGLIALLLILFIALGGKHGRRRGIAMFLAVFLILLILGGITAAVLAWLHPEYLTAIAFGLGAIAIIMLFLLLASGKKIPNPIHL